MAAFANMEIRRENMLNFAICMTDYRLASGQGYNAQNQSHVIPQRNL